MKPPLIAIDGPAGAGKSSTARALAAKIGVPYLDTGALYRAATYAVIKSGISLDDSQAITHLVHNTEFRFIQSSSGTRIWVDGEEVTEKLRSPQVAKSISSVCEISEVRTNLVAMQRSWAKRHFGVMEGRDIGTVVLPDAGLKIYMIARPEIRAMRRGKELGIADNPTALSKLAKELAERDRRDMERHDSPLRQADDAVPLDTSDMTFDEQVDFIVRLAAERFEIKMYGMNT